MNYYSMCHEVIDGGYTDGEVLFCPELDDYYKIGKPISLRGMTVSVALDRKVRVLKTDFFLTTCGAFFVSSELKDILENGSAKVKFAPADVKYFNGRSVSKDYFFIHADGKKSCFDYVQSEYSGKSMVLGKVQAGELGSDYKVRGVKRMFIDEAKAGVLDFFFVDGVIWVDPIVSETLMREIKDKKMLVRFNAVG